MMVSDSVIMFTSISICSQVLSPSACVNFPTGYLSVIAAVCSLNNMACTVNYQDLMIRSFVTKRLSNDKDDVISLEYD